MASPDPQHWTRPEHPVLSVRGTRRSQAALDTPTGFNPHPVPGARCLTLTQLGTDSTPDAQAQHPVPPWPAFGHSRDFSKLSTSAIENMYFIFSKSAKSHLASSVGGREEPKTVSTLQPPPPSQSVPTPPCVYQQALVLAFSQTFSLKELS